MYEGIVSCGTGISWERSVRFELCILTASESDVRSAGRAVSSDKRVIVSEHNLEREEHHYSPKNSGKLDRTLLVTIGMRNIPELDCFRPGSDN